MRERAENEDVCYAMFHVIMKCVPVLLCKLSVQQFALQWANNDLIVVH